MVLCWLLQFPLRYFRVRAMGSSDEGLLFMQESVTCLPLVMLRLAHFFQRPIGQFGSTAPQKIGPFSALASSVAHRQPPCQQTNRPVQLQHHLLGPEAKSQRQPETSTVNHSKYEPNPEHNHVQKSRSLTGRYASLPRYHLPPMSRVRKPEF